MDETLIRGDVNELQCILDFQKRGYYCSIPFSGSCRYDIIVDINGKLLRIQCKSSTFHEEDGTLRISTTRSTTNTKETIRYTYSKDEIDYFLTYFNKQCYLIPVEECGSDKRLRLLPTRSGQTRGISWAKDYELEEVIKKW